ncbi:MAG: hypothetical protein ACRDPY_26700 [Streptosporangiaceae bacterium]
MTRHLPAWAALLACGLAVAAGCSSSSAPPSWASALGSGVTVDAPAQVSAGTGSPGQAIEGVFAAIGSKQYKNECDYVEPDAQAGCKTGASALNSTNAPSLKNAGIGYVAIDGDKALVGSTGTFCTPDQTPKCFTNNDPAAIFSTKKSFSTLWTQANNSSSGNVYLLAPCIQIAGHWYLYSSSS